MSLPPDNQRIINELANLNPPKDDFTPQAVRDLLNYIGNPQDSYKVIHIAGTNGKGSTATFIEEGLLAGGFTVAKYTSPYIWQINECIMVNSLAISDDELARLYLQLQQVAKTHHLVLTSFEMLTAIMFYYAAQEKVDYLVLETGLGGLNDATNVVNSMFAVITNISLEHIQWLGTSLTDIARQKAGIIHDNPVIFADRTPELVSAISEKTTDYTNVLDKYIYRTKLNLDKPVTELEFWQNSPSGENHKIVNLGLLGHFQARNFLLAYEVLIRCGVREAQIFTAANKISWSGRLQIINKHPLILADAAHNVDGVSNLLNSLSGRFMPKRCVIVLSILKDKNVVQMLRLYAKLATTLVVCNLVNQPRALTARELAVLAKGKFENIHICNSPVAALEYAKRLKPQTIIVSGSTYLLKYILPT